MSDQIDDDEIEAQGDKEIPTAYGVELDSVVAVANAFVDGPFNGSFIAVRSSDDLVTIRSLETHFRHMDALLEAQKQGHISIRSISAGTNYDGVPCLNIEVVGGNDSTETTDKDATLTEYLSSVDNPDDSIDGAAKITHAQNVKGVWQTDGGEGLDDDPDEYRVKCSCGAEFGNWGKATRHVADE